VNGPALGATLVVIAVVCQVLLPGRAVYHAGWYSVVLAAIAIWSMVRLGRSPLIAFGLGAIAFAGIASGLLGPDTRTVLGAPGTSVRVDELGASLAFPLLQHGDAPVGLVRGNSAQPIDTQRYTSTVLLRAVTRTVVAIEALDRRGAHLTITQPTGIAFLSPVLLMQDQQTIAGLTLPYDSFAVPAAHRIVKTVLFTAREAESLPALASLHGPAVLFDVEDDSGASIPHGISVAAGGGEVEVAGLRLHPTVLDYPAIEMISIPDLAVVAAGLLAILIGLLLTRRRKPG